MTLAITSLGDALDTSNDALVTLSGISPTGNALLLVFATQFGAASNPILSVADTLTGTGAWTIPAGAQEETTKSGPTRYLNGGFAWAVAGPTPGTGDITVTFNSSSRDKTIHVVELTGFDTGTPLAQDDTNIGTGASLTVTLGASPDAVAAVVAGFQDFGGTDLSPGSGFTQAGNDQDTGDTVSMLMYDLVGADTTADASGMNSVANLGVAVEVSELSVTRRIFITHR